MTVDASGRLWVGSQYGALVSDDAGQTWRLMCDAPIGTTPNVYRITRSCVALAATSNGLFHSNDGGCDWARSGGSLGSDLIGDVAVDPTDGANVLAAVNVAGGISRIHLSNDGGFTFAPTDAYTPSETVFAQLRYGADGVHAYALATDGANVHIFVSSDSGRHWTLRDNFLSGQHAGLVGPNPISLDVVYYFGAGVNFGGANGVDYLLRSTDGGVTFAPLQADIAKIFAGAFASDGTLYVATDTGIRKSTDGIHFVAQPIVNQVVVSCLTVEDNTLYGCADESIAGFSVGKSTDAGLTWTPLLRIHDNVVGPLVCGSSSQVCSQCYSGWPDFATQLGLSDPQQPTCADAVPLACPAAPEQPSGMRPRPQACAFVAGSTDEHALAAGLILLAIALIRVRRQRR